MNRYGDKFNTFLMHLLMEKHSFSPHSVLALSLVHQDNQVIDAHLFFSVTSNSFMGIPSNPGDFFLPSTLSMTFTLYSEITGFSIDICLL